MSIVLATTASAAQHDRPRESEWTALARRQAGEFPRSDARDTKGRPWVTDPTGAVYESGEHKGQVRWVLYERPSGFGHEIEDNHVIVEWEKDNLLVGVGSNDALIERARALAGLERGTRPFRIAAEQLKMAASDASKAHIAAERGTHAHALTEDHDEERSWLDRANDGKVLDVPLAAQAALIEAWSTGMRQAKLKVLLVESRVVNDRYGVAGTQDRMVELEDDIVFTLHDGSTVTLPTGTVVVLDIKTGKLRLDSRGCPKWWNGYAVQLYLYASSLPYDCDTGTRAAYPWDVSQRWALIAHLDVLGAMAGRAAFKLILVDLEAGKVGAEYVMQVREWADSVPGTFSVGCSVAEVAVECATSDQRSVPPVASMDLFSDFGDSPTAQVAAELIPVEPSQPTDPFADFGTAEPAQVSQPQFTAFDDFAQPAPAPAPAMVEVEVEVATVPPVEIITTPSWSMPDEGEPLEATAFSELDVAYAALTDAQRSHVRLLDAQAATCGASFLPQPPSGPPVLSVRRLAVTGMVLDVLANTGSTAGLAEQLGVADGAPLAARLGSIGHEEAYWMAAALTPNSLVRTVSPVTA